MKFKYNSRTKKGELQVGYVEAVNRDMALNVLQGHDLYILSLDEVKIPKFYSSILKVFQRVKRVDLVVFTRQFSAMLEADLPLNDALKGLYLQTRNSTLKEAVFEMWSDIDAGLSLSQALEKHGNIFSEFYINLVRSAEVTGRIDEVMSFLADYLEKELALIAKVRNAMIYPIFILSLFLVVAGLLVSIVFPQLQPIFAESNVQLPLFTSILLGTGNFLAQWWLAVVIGAVLLAAILLDYLRSKEGKIIYGQLSINAPVFGNLFKKVYVSRFAEGLSVLIKGGIPVAQAIEISGHTIDNVLYRDLIHDLAERVRSGEQFSEALIANEKYFPPLISQMVAVGEKTGKLDEMLTRTAKFYTREVNDIVANLVELIQPTMMVIMGVLVGLLFASILLPIYSLIQSF
ncbi:MAG: type II secretion system F family protein [bacterium]|nr:type II secretion system F family protein [bacterium]